MCTKELGRWNALGGGAFDPGRIARDGDGTTIETMETTPFGKVRAKLLAPLSLLSFIVEQKWFEKDSHVQLG